MQRLCLLRVLFHRPQFALLDEATSALSLDVEEQLYQALLKCGVTLVSVGHRRSLLSHHHTLLSLDGTGGWTMESISSDSISNDTISRDSVSHDAKSQPVESTVRGGDSTSSVHSDFVVHMQGSDGDNTQVNTRSLSDSSLSHKPNGS